MGSGSSCHRIEGYEFPLPRAIHSIFLATSVVNDPAASIIWCVPTTPDHRLTKLRSVRLRSMLRSQLHPPSELSRATNNGTYATGPLCSHGFSREGGTGGEREVCGGFPSWGIVWNADAFRRVASAAQHLEVPTVVSRAALVERHDVIHRQIVPRPTRDTPRMRSTHLPGRGVLR